MGRARVLIVLCLSLALAAPADAAERHTFTRDDLEQVARVLFDWRMVDGYSTGYRLQACRYGSEFRVPACSVVEHGVNLGSVEDPFPGDLRQGVYLGLHHERGDRARCVLKAWLFASGEREGHDHVRVPWRCGRFAR